MLINPEFAVIDQLSTNSFGDAVSWRRSICWHHQFLPPHGQANCEIGPPICQACIGVVVSESLKGHSCAACGLHAHPEKSLRCEIADFGVKKWRDGFVEGGNLGRVK